MVASMFLTTAGNEAQFTLDNYLAGVLMASSDNDSKTNPQVVVPALADFAGTPNPEDLCNDYGPGSTLPKGTGDWKYTKATQMPPKPYNSNGTVMTNREFGRTIGWGEGNQSALDKMIEFINDGSGIVELPNKGVSSNMAQEWANMYKEQTYMLPDNPSSCGRMYLMQHITNELSRMGY